MDRWMSWEDPDDEVEGKTVAQDVYTARVLSRADILTVDSDRREQILVAIAILLAVALGCWLQVVRIAAPVKPDDIGRMVSDGSGTIQVLDAVDRPIAPRPRPVADRTAPSRRTVRRGRGETSGRSRRRGGDPRARVANRGVLQWASSQISGVALPDIGIGSPGGFAAGIDLALAGRQGAAVGGPGAGRRGITDIGFGDGLPGGALGIDDFWEAATATDAVPIAIQARTRRIEPVVRTDETAFGALGGGGRSRTSIQRTVMRYMPALRYAYTVRLRRRPGLRGKVTVRFMIDEFGNVIHASVLESTIGDSELERTVVDKIKRWKFERMDKPGDMTEIVYPFVFSI